MLEKHEPKKNHFFGAEVISPWKDLPQDGRPIDPAYRHITMAFLGHQEIKPPIPSLSFSIAPVGVLDSLLFLPDRNPRTISYHAKFLSKEKEFLSLQSSLAIKNNENTFLPHVTVARKEHPDKNLWREHFSPLPFFIKAIHLYESLGNLKYIPIKTASLLLPFESVDHTADLAFRIRGSSPSEIYLHAAIALSFSYPTMISHIENTQRFSSFEEIVKALNKLITKVDIEIGSPFKAVSLQGAIVEISPSIYEWEMIVDV